MIETKVFRALSNDTRVSIVRATLKKGEMSVSEIVDKVGHLQPVVSRELGTLKNAGLVVSRRDGGRTFYKVNETYRPLLELAERM